MKFIIPYKSYFWYDLLFIHGTDNTDFIFKKIDCNYHSSRTYISSFLLCGKLDSFFLSFFYIIEWEKEK